MQSNTLEQKIKNLSADYIYQQAVGSLLLLLMSTMEDAQRGEQPLSYPIHDDILSIKKEILNTTLVLEDILDGEQSARTTTLEHCIALKKKLFSIYETIYSYFSQWNVASTLVSDQIAIRKYKEEQISDEKIDWSLFFADCHTFLEEQDSLLSQKTAMGKLLQCLPLHIAREKYYDIIQQSLQAAFAGESKELITCSLRAFEGFCCPESNPLYGKYFPEIAKYIGEKRMAMPHNMDDAALQNHYASLKEVLEQLQEIEEYFSCMLHDINSLILLLYLTYNLKDLTEHSASYSDLYHAVCDFFNGEWNETEKSAFLETLTEQLEEAVEPVIDKANTIAKQEYALLEKVQTFAQFDEETQKVLWTEEFIRDCYFGNLNDQLFQFSLPEDLPPATEAEKKTLFTEFIQKTRSYLETLPVQTRKIAMQTLIGALPPIFDVHTVMDMVAQAIDKTTSLEQKILIVDKVGMVFQESGYQSITHTAHHHDHDCDCGSHHHHDHDCDCGSHHHHDHDCDCGSHHHHDHDCDCGSHHHK